MNSLKKRLQKLETDLQVESIELELSNSKRLYIKRRDVLRITTDGMRRRYAEMEGLPMPKSKFDRELDLLQRVSCPPANQPLLAIACAALNRGKAER